MASYLLADNAPLGGVAGSPTEWVLVPAYSERPWKSPEKGAHPLRLVGLAAPYAGHRKGPRPVVCKINLHFRRFSSGTGQITGLIVYYIAPRPKDARRGSSVSRAHDLA